MSAGTHDDGRLFGWDGVSMWTEPTLGDSVTTREVVTCRHSLRERHDPWDPCDCGYVEGGMGCACPCHGDHEHAWCATCRRFVDYPGAPFDY